MSRIFEALQQSELDRTGFIPPESELVATEMLRAAEIRLEDKEDVNEPFPQGLGLRSAISGTSRLIARTEGWSLGSEKFRLLALRLRQLRQRRPLKKVLITSTVAEEGKSFVSANLAITMARKKEQKILLLEGDLRRPVLANNLGLGNLTGLSEYVQSNKPVTHAVRHIEDLGFWILPAGHPPGNPVEIIQSVQLVQALEQLSSSFDWIIVDSPPLLPLADASVWARAVDGTLLVTRQGKTEKGQLKRGIEMLDKSNLVGVVINDCSVANQSNYYQRYGSPSSNSL